MACHTRVSSVPTARSGIPAPKHSPLAVDTPTLRPVYEPGPMLTHTAEQSPVPMLHSSSISLMNTAVRDACDFVCALSLLEMILPSLAMAAEHSAVDVSISMMVSISVLFENKVFKIRENAVCRLLERRVQDRVGQHFLRHEVQGRVE